MATRLENLIESIDPSRTIERVSVAVDDAFNAFKYHNPIRTFEEYEEYMAKFVQHIEQIVLKFKSNSPYDKEYFWHKYSMFFSNHDQKDWKWNYEKIITGQDGGLYQVLKNVAAKMIQYYSRNEIFARISDYWNSLNIEEKLAATDEFVRKFGHTLPARFTEGNSVFLKINFVNILKKYPHFLLEMRRSVR